MMRKRNKAIMEAIEKGYKVDADGVVYSPDNYVRKLQTDKGGYHYFGVRCSDGKSQNIHVHRMQAYQKYGEEVFGNGIVCRHINGKPSDNSYDNIVIGTQKDNMNDIPKEKRILNASNPKHNHFDIVKDYYENDLSYAKLMSKYGIKSKGTISHIVKKSLASEEYRIKKLTL